MKTYCIVCKKETENKNPKIFKTKNGRVILKAPVQYDQDLLVKTKDLVYYQILKLELL